MIDTTDQEQLFTLIADYLERDITCVAIGGTAMMFKRYKTTTKDIDLVFQNDRDREAFVRAIEQLGYQQGTLRGIYDDARRQHGDAPQMYTRGDERFDLFVTSVFGFPIDREGFTERWDYLGTRALTILLLDTEHLILLKAITRRDRDREDIETIIRADQIVDWDRIVDLATERTDDAWILVDLEETLQELKALTHISHRCFDRIYDAQQRHQT